MECRTEAYLHNLADHMVCESCGKEHWVDCASVRLVINGMPMEDDLCDECIEKGAVVAADAMRKPADRLRRRVQEGRETAEQLKQRAEDLRQQAEVIEQGNLGWSGYFSQHAKFLRREADCALKAAERSLNFAKKEENCALGWEEEAERPEGPWASLEDLEEASRVAKEYLAREQRLIESRARTST